MRRDSPRISSVRVHGTPEWHACNRGEFGYRGRVPYKQITRNSYKSELRSVPVSRLCGTLVTLKRSNRWPVLDSYSVYGIPIPRRLHWSAWVTLCGHLRSILYTRRLDSTFRSEIVARGEYCVSGTRTMCTQHTHQIQIVLNLFFHLRRCHRRRHTNTAPAILWIINFICIYINEMSIISITKFYFRFVISTSKHRKLILYCRRWMEALRADWWVYNRVHVSYQLPLDQTKAETKSGGRMEGEGETTRARDMSVSTASTLKDLIMMRWKGSEST